jgi:hypothetical protein
MLWNGQENKHAGICGKFCMKRAICFIKSNDKIEITHIMLCFSMIPIKIIDEMITQRAGIIPHTG